MRGVERELSVNFAVGAEAMAGVLAASFRVNKGDLVGARQAINEANERVRSRLIEEMIRAHFNEDERSFNGAVRIWARALVNDVVVGIESDPDAKLGFVLRRYQ